MKITVLDGHTLNPGDNPWTPLECFGDLQVFERSPVEEIVARSAESEILLTNKTPLSRETLGQLPKLKFVSVLATGTNVVDLEAAKEQGVVVSNVPQYSTDSVAQHVLAMVLSMIHRPFEHSSSVYAGDWQNSPDFSYSLGPLTELRDKTLGVVGFGMIGRRVCELGAAFGMNVLAYNPSLKNKTRLDYLRFDWCTLEQVFCESDFVSLHCPLTKENAEFVDSAFLQMMKPSALLINTARGGLVNEADLASALANRQIAGACLDVVSEEPMRRDNPLLASPNCLITPHIGWATVEARTRLMKTTADNIEAYLSGHPINVVN